jgi:hypothetical protein
MSKDIELTPLQRQERCGMVGDRNAILDIVDGLRHYRKLMKRLIDGNIIHPDGSDELINEVNDIEEMNGQR